MWVVLGWTQNEIDATIPSVFDSTAVDSLEIGFTKEDSTEIDSIFYSADSVFYSLKDGVIKLSGNASLTYHSSIINADTITIDIDNKQAFTKGRSFMKDGSQNMLGDEIYYDIETRWGLVTKGASKFDKGYYYGEEIRKIEKEIYDIDDGIFTTCDALHPHFYIRMKKFRLFKDDKIMAKPVVFYVNHFPVFAMPMGTFTIKRGRQSGILVPSPGINKADGKYVENIAYYIAYKNNADITLSMDYYEKTGWELALRSYYLKRYIFNGKFDAVYQKNVVGPNTSSNEWNVHARHHHDYGNKTTFDADLNFISSTKIWEGNEDIDERLAEKITSSLSYKKPFIGSMLYLSSRYVDDFKNETKDITLPSASFSLPSKPVYELFVSEDSDIAEDAWWKEFSFSYSFKAIHVGDINDPDADFYDVIYQTEKDSTGEYINQHNAGMKHYGSLKYSYKYKGWLNLSPSVSCNEAWFDRDKNNNKLVRGSDYNASFGLSFNLYGLRDIPELYVCAIRHIISPSISFTYKPDFTENDKFYSFGGISLNSSDKQRKISVSLGNKWQLKLSGTEKTNERKINDFFKINSGISYDFEKEGRGFSNISHRINLNPNNFKLAFFDLSTKPSGSITQDTYELEFTNWNYKDWDWAVSNWTARMTSKLSLSGDAGYIDYFPVQRNEFITSDFFGGDTLSTEEERIITTLEELDELAGEKKNWSFGFSHTYETNKTSYENHDYSSSFRSSVSAKLTKNWTISYANYINLKENELVSHNFTITRDLHCWKVFFKYTKQGDYWNYRFQIFNIKLPDALKFRTSDHKH
ncbi:MAG: hypothetical protein K8R49_00550 [Candidatus Cloacimonetes bacterium]|nr:hypothetical protein [Candidatus Cloacimonadota bacterium]